MLEESYLECIVRWHLYRKRRRHGPRAHRAAEYVFHTVLRAADDGIFIDLGANIGDVSHAARKYGREVIAFEPDTVALPTLRERFKADTGVTIHPVAVGSSARTATFFRHPNVAANIKGTESSSFFQRDKHGGGSPIDVEVIDLVSFLRTVKQPIAVLKMDIEGAEVECLDAILDAGLHKEIGHILVETHERFSPELASSIGRIRDRVASERIRNINLDWH